jgi:hypothetical protein
MIGEVVEVCWNSGPLLGEENVFGAQPEIKQLEVT